MRNFFITLLAFIIALSPIVALFFGFLYLDVLCLYLSIPVTFSYFVLGFLIGVYRKLMIREYQDFWWSVWERAGDRL